MDTELLGGSEILHFDGIATWCCSGIGDCAYIIAGRSAIVIGDERDALVEGIGRSGAKRRVAQRIHTVLETAQQILILLERGDLSANLADCGFKRVDRNLFYRDQCIRKRGGIENLQGGLAKTGD